MPNGVNDLVDRERPYPLHPDVPAYIMALLAEVKRLEDLILAAFPDPDYWGRKDGDRNSLDGLDREADAIRERRKA